jgi:hypothetical protein
MLPCCAAVGCYGGAVALSAAGDADSSVAIADTEFSQNRLTVFVSSLAGDLGERRETPMRPRAAILSCFGGVSCGLARRWPALSDSFPDAEASKCQANDQAGLTAWHK